jgi:hypothetical protein
MFISPQDMPPLRSGDPDRNNCAVKLSNIIIMDDDKTYGSFMPHASIQIKICEGSKKSA